MECRLQFVIVLLLVSVARSQLYDPWSKWSKCSVTCGVGSRQRQRQCSDGLCTQRQTQGCVRESCPGSPEVNRFAEWNDWSPCSQTCGDGKQERQRSCINGGCIQKESRSCRLRTCEGDIQGWSEWTDCSATCGQGVATRQRRCAVGSCIEKQTKTCYLKPCSSTNITIGFEKWQEWSECSATCGPGERRRIRRCKSGTCQETAVQTCSIKPCGAITLGDWQKWGKCSTTCGIGIRKRKRNCVVGFCEQTQTSSCRIKPCPGGPPEYLDWQAWEPCSVTCGVGEQKRTRRCVVGLCQQVMRKSCLNPTCSPDDPPPFLPWESWSDCTVTCGAGERRRSRQCKPPATCIQHQAQSCNVQPCDDPTPVPSSPTSEYGEWSKWSQCSASCGSGETKRQRVNVNTGRTQDQLKQCTIEKCRPGKRYRNWGQWSGCSVTCGTGISTRIRLCRVGTCEDTETKPCTLEDCKIIDPDEKYGEWLSWSECSVSCGFGFARRERYCRIGDCKQTSSKTCRLGPCPTDYTEWEDWSECSVTCGSGIATRKRYCTVGTCEEKQQTPCDKPTCATGWEDWSNWQGCHKTCGGGFDYRTRRCKEPLPSVQCPGDDYSYSRCNTQPCINGTWGDWSEWGDCSKTCGTGVSKRTRSCESGECDGDDEERRDCNTDACVQAHWSNWSVWSECTVTCGVGEKARTRICINGKRWDKGCFGSVLTKEQCNQPSCEQALWSKWTPWRPCSASCGEGTTNRERVCIRKTPSAPQCNGQSSETNKCETVACSASAESEAEWSLWLPWSDCPVTCGLGTQSRSRICSQPGLCEGDNEQAIICDQGACPKPQIIPGSSKLNAKAGRTAQSDAAARDVPWHVLLFSDENQVFTKGSETKLGSGSLINNKWVLTSAHIIGNSQESNPTSILLVFGIVDEFSGADSVPSHAQFYRAGSVVLHPKFHKKTYDYDLALVRVGARLEVEGGLLVPDKLRRIGTVQFDSYVSPIALPCISSCDQSRETTQNGISIAPFNRIRCLRYARKFKSVTNSNTVVSGYSTVGGSTKLRIFSRKLYNTQKCREEMKKIRASNKWARYTGRNVCTDKDAPPQPCSGSKGDPLMKEVQGTNSKKCWVLLGVFTHNWSCETANAQYYADVPELISWIAKSIA